MSAGSNIWFILEGLERCFNNSLPLNLSSICIDTVDKVLNLTCGVSNIDESGTVFETCRFLSCLSRLSFGSSLQRSIGFEKWKKLFQTDPKDDWLAGLALAYEMALCDNDVRPMENFIDTSNFLKNNNMFDKLSINKTNNDFLRLSTWIKEDKSGRQGERLYHEQAKNRTTSPSTKINDVDKDFIDLRAKWAADTESENMSFSYVLSCILFFRVFVCSEKLENLLMEKKSKNQCWDYEKIVPLIRGLSIVSNNWTKHYITTISKDCVECSLRDGHFTDIERDPIFFYRFIAYVLGVVLKDDSIFESISTTICDSFDFNGFDTRNWNLFIQHHFNFVNLGRRAKMLSLPVTFIKRIIGWASKPPTTDVIEEGEYRNGRISSIIRDLPN